jgi:hypothetical protein
MPAVGKDSLVPDNQTGAVCFYAVGFKTLNALTDSTVGATGPFRDVSRRHVSSVFFEYIQDRFVGIVDLLINHISMSATGSVYLCTVLGHSAELCAVLSLWLPTSII